MHSEHISGINCRKTDNFRLSLTSKKKEFLLRKKNNNEFTSNEKTNSYLILSSSYRHKIYLLTLFFYREKNFLTIDICLHKEKNIFFSSGLSVMNGYFCLHFVD